MRTIFGPLLVLMFFSISFQAAASSPPSKYFDFQVETRNPKAFSSVRENADETLIDLSKRLGAPGLLEDETKIKVTIVSDRAAFQEAQAHLGGTHHWAAGTAYPSKGLIFLSLDAHDYFSKEGIALHEIAHIAVYRAAGKRRLPRWFEEGIAIYLAGEELVSRVEATNAATVFQDLPALADFDKRFPKGSSEARLAYAVGSLFVNYLSLNHDFESSMPVLFHSLRKGTAFKTAFRRAMGDSLENIERQWRKEMSGSSSWIANFSDGEMIWGLASLLFVVASWRAFRRKENAIANMPADNTPEEDEPWPPTGMPM